MVSLLRRLVLYNPNTNPATVDLNFERALYWVETGAQPTDTARNILKGEGVYMMKHLRVVLRRAHSTRLHASRKFDAWKQAKVAATEAVEKKVTDAKKAAAAQNLEAEKKVNEAIAKKVADKKAAALQHRLRLRQHRLLRILLLRLLQRRHQQRHNPRSQLKHKSIDSSRVYGLFYL